MYEPKLVLNAAHSTKHTSQGKLHPEYFQLQNKVFPTYYRGEVCGALDAKSEMPHPRPEKAAGCKAIPAGMSNEALTVSSHIFQGALAAV